MPDHTEVLYSDIHKWHVFYKGELALRGQHSREIAERAAVDIAANNGRLPRKSKRSRNLDLRTGREETS